VLVGLTGASFWGFGAVRQAFFPDSNTPIFFIDIQLPQGTDIRATATLMREVDAEILREVEVLAVSSFAGGGASRFMLTYAPGSPNTGYGQFIIRTANRDVIDPIAARLAGWIRDHHPEASVRTSRLVFGPGGGAKIQARFSGGDPAVLRDLADRALRELEADGGLICKSAADLDADRRGKLLVAFEMVAGSLAPMHIWDPRAIPGVRHPVPCAGIRQRAIGACRERSCRTTAGHSLPLRATNQNDRNPL
jgi:multidrug efflux pump subunit AcrB